MKKITIYTAMFRTDDYDECLYMGTSIEKAKRALDAARPDARHKHYRLEIEKMTVEVDVEDIEDLKDIDELLNANANWRMVGEAEVIASDEVDKVAPWLDKLLAVKNYLDDHPRVISGGQYYYWTNDDGDVILTLRIADHSCNPRNFSWHDGSRPFISVVINDDDPTRDRFRDIPMHNGVELRFSSQDNTDDIIAKIDEQIEKIFNK